LLQTHCLKRDKAPFNLLRTRQIGGSRLRKPGWIYEPYIAKAGP
jgi:hypothetical protein